MEKQPKSPSSFPQATSWIFIRGMVRAAAHWGDYPQQFEQSVPGAIVSCLEIPGNGKLIDKNSPLTVGAMTDALRQMYRTRTPDDILGLPTFIVGMSLGGMIVLDYLSRYPDDLCGAVTINTSAGNVNPVYRRLNPFALLSFARIGMTRNPRQRERKILELTAQSEPRRAAALDNWSELAVSAPVNLTNSLRQLVAAARFRLPENLPRKPLLMLNSAADRIAHPSCSRRIAERWHADLKTNPYAGHDLPIDDPEWITEAIQEWRRSRKL